MGGRVKSARIKTTPIRLRRASGASIAAAQIKKAPIAGGARGARIPLHRRGHVSVRPHHEYSAGRCNARRLSSVQLFRFSPLRRGVWTMSAK
jgi:hypothetical protein